MDSNTRNGQPRKDEQFDCERRYCRLERRQGDHDNEDRTRGGTAMHYGSTTMIGTRPWGWIETMQAGCFSEYLNDDENDVMSLFMHRRGDIVARRANDTMAVTDGKKELKVDAEIIDTTLGDDLLKLIDGELIDGLSVGIYVRSQTWTFNEPDAPDERTIVKADLFEVSFVDIPAFDDARVKRMRDLALQSDKSLYNKAIVGTLRRKLTLAQVATWGNKHE